LAEGDGEAEVVDVFFLVAVDVAVELLVVPDFFAATVVVDFLPVVEAVVLEVDSFLCVQETKKATPTRSVMKEKTVFFIGLSKGAQTVQPAPKPQA
jgi:hypothetical protein